MSETIKKEVIELIFKMEMQKRPQMRSVFSTENQQLVHDAPGREEGQSDAAPSLSDALPAQQKRPTQLRRTAEKVGRNDPCPCGSGKKYKKCCGT